MSFEGWRITGWLAAAMLAATALWLGVAGWSEESIRVVVRGSARSSMGLFSLAFASSSLALLWQGSATRWLLRNRRYVGVAFGFSHFVHLAALVALAISFPDPFVQDLNALALVGGGLGYVFIAGMVATSSDRARDRLGSTAWRRLHRIGGYYVWLIFLQSYGFLALGDFAYLPAFAILIAAVAVRGFAWHRERA